MTKSRQRERTFVPLLVWAVLLAGGAGGWWLRGAVGPSTPLFAAKQTRVAVKPAPPHDRAGEVPVMTSDPPPPVMRAVDDGADLVKALRERRLRLPVDGIDVKSIEGQFGQTRDGGKRGHEAVDILAPRGTPVRAVERGTIAKLFVSKAGGNTIYQFDPSERVSYYYAHLDAYAAGLREGQAVNAGDVIGYVGTTGNAPPGTPHLHFAVFELTAERRWWKGTPLDPFAIFRP